MQRYKSQEAREFFASKKEATEKDQFVQSLCQSLGESKADSRKILSQRKKEDSGKDELNVSNFLDSEKIAKMLGPIKTGQLSPVTDRLSQDMNEDAPMQLLTGNAEDYGFCELFASKGRQTKLEYANSLECPRNMVEDEIRENYPLWNAKGNLL